MSMNASSPTKIVAGIGTVETEMVERVQMPYPARTAQARAGSTGRAPRRSGEGAAGYRSRHGDRDGDEGRDRRRDREDYRSRHDERRNETVKITLAQERPR